ncbi:RICIN domain-containing protein [Halocatena halophila]|uniref:RICIN domain-containing protein n=1 Tax=Halocatena halophila TaxID=2814576 RepID=UPI002ED3D634
MSYAPLLRTVLGGGLLGTAMLAQPVTGTNGAAPYRPAYHVTPQRGWMNDPNGLVYHDGTYHLFYRAGEDFRRWDHATSRDLISWTHHGTKIPHTDTIQAFSGGAVVDTENTAGFGHESIVCLYTGHHTATGIEDQRLAYSTDGGDTVRKFVDNPILSDGHDDWRDPNPFWYAPDDSWRLAVARVSANGTDRPAGIEFYASDDFRDWTYLSTYESSGVPWECPDCYRLPVSNTGMDRWVVTVSTGFDHVEHHIGWFDGSTFTAEKTVPADFGWDFYAAQSWSNEPAVDDRLLVGWMNNWAYARETPPSGWQGVQSYPRRLGLTMTENGVVPVQTLDESFFNRRQHSLVEIENAPVTATNDPLADHQTIGVPYYEIVTEIDPGTADAVTIATRVDHGVGQEIRITYDCRQQLLTLDRSDAGVFFGDRPQTSTNHSLRPGENGTIRLRMLVDRSSITTIANGGEKWLSARVFPDETSTDTTVSATGGRAVLTACSVYTLHPAIEDGGVYRIENVNSGNVLDVRNGDTSDGAVVQQWEDLGYDHQRWIAHEISTDRYWFESVHSSKALDIENAALQSGAETTQWEWQGAASQQWIPQQIENGIYRVQNVNSSLALDITDASRSNGARGMQWEWWGGDNQKWRFERVG